MERRLPALAVSGLHLHAHRECEPQGEAVRPVREVGAFALDGDLRFPGSPGAQQDRAEPVRCAVGALVVEPFLRDGAPARVAAAETTRGRGRLEAEDRRRAGFVVEAETEGSVTSGLPKALKISPGMRIAQLVLQGISSPVAGKDAYHGIFQCQIRP